MGEMQSSFLSITIVEIILGVMQLIWIIMMVCCFEGFSQRTKCLLVIKIAITLVLALIGLISCLSLMKNEINPEEAAYYKAN